MSKRTTLLPIHPAPSEEWERHESRLLSDAWLSRKVFRSRRIKEHVRYINQYVPEFRNWTDGSLIDIGPGPGEFLEIARAQGMNHLGIDATIGIGGMGKEYLEYSRLWHERQDLNVRYESFESFIRDYQKALAVFERYKPIRLINMRGSIEQCLSSYQKGDPHHLHHKAEQLEWVFSEGLYAMVDRMFHLFSDSLDAGGLVLIHCNKRSEKFARTLKGSAHHIGFDILIDNERLFKWAKK